MKRAALSRYLIDNPLSPIYPQSMEIHLTPEQEAHLQQLARHEGKTPEQLVFDATLHLYEEDRLFREGVQRGLDQANAGSFLEEEEMDARFEKMIRR